MAPGILQTVVMLPMGEKPAQATLLQHMFEKSRFDRVSRPRIAVQEEVRHGCRYSLRYGNCVFARGQLAEPLLEYRRRLEACQCNTVSGVFPNTPEQISLNECTRLMPLQAWLDSVSRVPRQFVQQGINRDGICACDPLADVLPGNRVCRRGGGANQLREVCHNPFTANCSSVSLETCPSRRSPTAGYAASSCLRWCLPLRSTLPSM